MEQPSADWPRGASSGDPQDAHHEDSPNSIGVEDDDLARPGTGEPRVDAALRLLDGLADMPVSEHPAVYERVHAQLSDVLGELDTGPGS